MNRFALLVWAVCAMSAVPTTASAQVVNLAPGYQSHQQTDSERLQYFRTPSPGGVESNVRFSIPGQR
jgi:hypothetical protein